MNQQTINQGYEKPEVIDTFEALEVVGDTSGAGVAMAVCGGGSSICA